MIAYEDKYIFGNNGGYTLMEEIQIMKRQTHKLNAKIEDQDRRIEDQDRRTEDQDRRVATLESQVSLLTQNSKKYLCIRERFLDVYKRDFKGFQGSRAIREGNLKAHSGDALTDASLFSDGQRSDTDVYQELYGLEYKQVLEIHGKYIP